MFEPGEFLTRWTVRAAVTCWFGRVLAEVALAPSLRRDRLARALWTMGCGLYLAHVALAFHVFHGWSHAHALRVTADQTYETVGLHWGGGLYVNYAFTLLWLTDVAAWWRIGLGFPRRYRKFYWCVQAAFAFIVVNATVVFGPPHWRWLGAVAAVVLAAAYGWRHSRRGAGL